MKKPILAALALCYALGAAAQTPDTAAPEGYRFTDVKILPVTPVKDQSRSGTCWCYSTLSFFESEILRAGGPELDLSEMWIVRNIYFEKAVKYVRLHGSLNLAVGGQAHDGILAEQRASLLRFHIGLADMHAIHLDALVARLPHHIHAVVDHKRHGIGLAAVLDDLRDIAGHFGDILRIRVLGAQLDERRAPTQRVIHHIRHRPALAILRTDHEIRAHIKAVAHRGEWIIIHWFPLCCSLGKCSRRSLVIFRLFSVAPH